MAKKKVHAARKPARKSSNKKAPKSAGRPRAARAAASKGGAEKAAAIALLAWVHRTTDALIDSFPADKCTYQSCTTDNHVLWTIGHLATAYSWFASLIDGRTAGLPEAYDKMFGYKSVPNADPNAYPPLDEIKQSYRLAYRRLDDAVNGLKPADLAKPTATDAHGFASSRLDAIHKAVWHDGWHSGQLSTLRRALGLPAMM